MRHILPYISVEPTMYLYDLSGNGGTWWTPSTISLKLCFLLILFTCWIFICPISWTGIEQNCDYPLGIFSSLWQLGSLWTELHPLIARDVPCPNSPNTRAHTSQRMSQYKLKIACEFKNHFPSRLPFFFVYFLFLWLLWYLFPISKEVVTILLRFKVEFLML